MAKLTESLLRKIIKEELRKVLMLNEARLTAGYLNGKLSKLLDILKSKGLEEDAEKVSNFLKRNRDQTVRFYKQGTGDLSVETMYDLNGEEVEYSQNLLVLSPEAAKAIGF